MTAVLVTFNGWVGNRNWSNNLYGLADDAGYPLAIATQETKRFRGAFPGYVRVDAGPNHPRGADAYSTVLFVRRRGVTIVKERVVEVAGPDWIGPKHGIKHPPRVFVGATLEDDATGQRWDVLAVHRTFRSKKNAGAWEAEDTAIVAWVEARLERHPNRPIVLLADWNSRRSDRRPLGVRDLAERLGAQLLIHRLDGALLINCHGKSEALPDGYGGDGHRPVVITAHTNQEKS